ncbi:MAG: M67 family metallopeptidase [Anaerolineaceae bacterium]|nr:M67 family metallopeptidase [Anaerolineaceae bacterium]
MKIELSKALQQKIFKQMEGTFPNEGGGFLLGTRSGNTVSIIDVIQIENIFESEEQYHRYAMSPKNWADMEDTADERGMTLVGYYHSHPDSPAIPSEYDRVHALPNFVYIISSVMAGEAVEMFVWLLRDDRSAFDQLELDLQA